MGRTSHQRHGRAAFGGDTNRHRADTALRQDEATLRRAAEARLGAVGAVGASAGETGGLEQLLRLSLERTLEVTSFETGLLFIADRRSGELVLEAWLNLSERAATGLRSLPVGMEVLHRALRAAEPSVLHDLSSQFPTLAAEGLRTAVLAPLRSLGAAQGVLVVAARALCELPASDLGFMMTIANLVAAVVDNAQLRLEADRKLQVQTHLNELSAKILTMFELDAIMPMVLRSAQELTGADGVGIALGESEGARSLCTLTLPSGPHTVPIPLERLAEREVTLTRRPVVVDDYRAHPTAIASLVDAGLARLIAVPLAYADRMFGTLTLFNLSGSRPFVGADLAVATELGRRTGIAIESARMHQRTRFYVRQVTRAQEDERRRIARELHDETIQNLVVISRRLEGLSSLADGLPAAAQERITAVQELLADTMRGVRRSVHDLRPPTLDYLGLVASVEALVTDLRDNGLEARVRIVGEPRRLEPEEELLLFRIAQEALGNARRHSAARTVELQMEFDADAVRLSVSDNGCGFSVPESFDDLVCQEKLGLIGMNERARTLGGVLDIHSRPGRGTRVTVAIPAQPITGSE